MISHTRFSYFGYGSLVNGDTRPAETIARPAELKGWRREWRIASASMQNNVCALSIRQDIDCAIKGVLVTEDIATLPNLDKREALYDRLTISASDATPYDPAFTGEAIYVYKGSEENTAWGSPDFPILLSYLDCVLAGFHAHWGDEGIAHFMATTDGWHVPIENDRTNPRYPRWVTIDNSLQEKIDDALVDANAKFL